MENKLRAWDHFNEVMIYSNEDDAVFILHENKWKIKYTREKTIQRGDVEIDAPVWEESEDVEVMRFSGLQDKNKKDIYDGDIVNVDWDDVRYKPCIYGVKWDAENSCFIFGAGSTSEVGWSHEVIGNIYQNENLLK